MININIDKLNLKNKDLIRFLKQNKEGLTLSELARQLDTNIYGLKEDLAILQNKKVVIITDAGRSKLVRIKE